MFRLVDKNDIGADENERPLAPDSAQLFDVSFHIYPRLVYATVPPMSFDRG